MFVIGVVCRKKLWLLMLILMSLIVFVLVSWVGVRFVVSLVMGFKVSVVFGWVMIFLFLLVRKVKFEGVGLSWLMVVMILFSVMLELVMFWSWLLVCIG